MTLLPPLPPQSKVHRAKILHHIERPGLDPRSRRVRRAPDGKLPITQREEEDDAVGLGDFGEEPGFVDAVVGDVGGFGGPALRAAVGGADEGEEGGDVGWGGFAGGEGWWVHGVVVSPWLN